MVTVKIKENSKEAVALLQYLQSLPFVEVLDKTLNTEHTPKPDGKKLDAIAQKINKAATSRMMKEHGIGK